MRLRWTRLSRLAGRAVASDAIEKRRPASTPVRNQTPASNLVSTRLSALSSWVSIRAARRLIRSGWATWLSIATRRARGSVRCVSGSSRASTPEAHIARTDDEGSGASSSFNNSFCARSNESRGTAFILSDENRGIVCAASLQAASAATSGSPRPYQAWKRKKRSIRRWSSAMRVAGSPTKRTRPASRSSCPPK